MKPIQVRLMNDYTVEWPLWTDGETDESDRELSPPLTPADGLGGLLQCALRLGARLGLPRGGYAAPN